MPGRITRLSGRDFDLFRDLVEKESGIHLRPEKITALEALVAKRLEQLLLPDTASYIKYIHANEAVELQKIVPALANHETYFFRDRAQLAAFKSLLPRIKAGKEERGGRLLSVLSAGCAGGEEAYTLRILAGESGLFSEGWEVVITGVDLDRFKLEQAEKGVYGANSLRLEREGAKFISEYFDKAGEKYILKGRYRRDVNFRAGNILKPEALQYPSGFDFIFCRNVFIYMTDDAIRRVAANLHACLAGHGYLFAGHAEPLSEKTDLFRPERVEGAIVYRKSGTKG